MIEGTGTIGVEFSGSGFALSDNSRPPRLFKIVSGTNPYTATPVHLKESDASRPNDGTSNITAAQKVLHEVNAVSTVKADTIVEATPNEYGTGWYFTAPSGSGCGLPFVYKVQVGTSVAKSAGNVTDVYVRYRNVTVDANGCVSISDPMCETAATAACSTSDTPEYYCIDGVCWKYYDGIVPGSYDAGPFSTPELCDADCPFPPSGEGVPDCCPTESHDTLTATISGGHGTMTLTWDGSAWWTGSKALSCGETLHFRYPKDCNAPEFSCSGALWLPCPSTIGTPTCTPLTDPRSFTCDMNDVNAGCAGGGCGSLTVSVAV